MAAGNQVISVKISVAVIILTQECSGTIHESG